MFVSFFFVFVSFSVIVIDFIIFIVNKCHTCRNKQYEVFTYILLREIQHDFPFYLSLPYDARTDG